MKINKETKRVLFVLAMALLGTASIAKTRTNVTQLRKGNHFYYEGRGYTIVGENMIKNPSFDNGLTGWVGGAGGALANTTLKGSGGSDNGTYIIPTQNDSKGSNGSIGMAWEIEKGKTYVFSYFVNNTGGGAAVEKENYIVTSQTDTPRGDETMTIMYGHEDAGGVWTQNIVVTEAQYTYLQFLARWLAGSKGFDAFILAEVEQDADPTELINLCEKCTEWLAYYDEPDEEAYNTFETIIAEAFNLGKEGASKHNAKEFNAMIAKLNEALLDFRMACADDENTVDVTSRYIKNPDFGNGLVDWERSYEAVDGGANIRVFSYFQPVTDRVLEVNCPTREVIVSQTIKGLPKGKYIFSFDCVMTHRADMEDSNAETGAWIFCNGAEQILKTKEMTFDGADYEDAHPQRFEIRGVVADTSIVVGLRVNNEYSTSYIAIDNVKLEYAGFNVGVYLQALVEEVQDYLNDNESTLLPKIYDELADLSMEAESYLGDEDNVMNEWYDKLYDGFKKAKDSFTKLAELGDITNSFLELLKSTEYEGLEAAQAVYEEAQNLVDGNDDEATYETIVAMIAKVEQAIIDYQKSQTATHDTPADYSFFIVNPQCYTNTTGWTGTAAGFEYNVAEFYNKDFDLYQTLTDLPNGIYEVTMYGFYRTGANDGGEAYRTGGENLIAKLYANDMSVSVMSLYTFTAEECGVSGTNGYISVRQYADEAFNNGFYSENKVKVIVTDGKLTIGVRGTGHEGNSWFAFRDFGLKYFGPAIITGSDGCITWNLDIVTGALTISGSGSMNDYDCSDGTIATPWKDYSSLIKKVDIQTGITRIGNNAFRNCYNLSSISISESVTSIGESAFKECRSLTFVILPSSLESVGNEAFEYSILTLVINLSDIALELPTNCEEYKRLDLFEFTADTFAYSNSAPIPVYTKGSAPFTISLLEPPFLEKNVGTYTAYYQFHFAGELEFNVTIPYAYTITPASVTINVTSVSREYGDANPEFGYTVDGLFGNDSMDVTLAAPGSQSKVGSYSFTASTTDENYSIANTTGTLTITKAPLTIAANNVSRLYFEDTPEYTFSSKGWKNGENASVLTAQPTMLCAAEKTSPAGVYDIVPSGAEAQNYDISYQNGSLTIGKRMLMVTAKDAERYYGEKNPEFECTFDGFVNDETEAVLTTKPEAVTTAEQWSDVGSYSIVMQGGEATNYTFNYVPGTLSILKAQQRIEWEQAIDTVAVGSQVLLTATATSGLEVTYKYDDSMVEVYSSFDGMVLDCFKEGTVTIRATQEGNQNYYPAERMSKTINIVSTGIAPLTQEEDAAIYDLQGRKVLEAVKGFYLQDGKKVYRK